MEAQARQVMENIGATLRSAGVTFDDVFHCTVMLDDMAQWGDFNRVYVTYFTPGRLPARSALGADGLALGALVEVECQAHAPATRAAAAPATGGAPTSSVLARASTTVTGQRLATLPQPYEVVVTRTELPAGGVLPPHRHPWPRYAIVESGEIHVTYEGGHRVEASAGETIVEAVGTWHEGRAVGGPVQLIVIDHVPPGRVNIEQRR
jgi:quercetin dioxygenase-like cupin family protein